jgi:hypothetical protein
MGSRSLFRVTATVARHFYTFDGTAVVAVNVNVNVVSGRRNSCHVLPLRLPKYAARPTLRASKQFTFA